MRRAFILVTLLLFVGVAILFVSLGRSESPHDPSSFDASEPTETLQEGKEALNLGIVEGNNMVPNVVTVEEGDRVYLRITSDHPVEFHIHGYELEEELEPGKPEELSFDATIPGRFEIEDHNTEVVLGVLLVQPR